MVAVAAYGQPSERRAVCPGRRCAGSATDWVRPWRPANPGGHLASEAIRIDHDDHPERPDDERTGAALRHDHHHGRAYVGRIDDDDIDSGAANSPTNDRTQPDDHPGPNHDDREVGRDYLDRGDDDAIGHDDDVIDHNDHPERLDDDSAVDDNHQPLARRPYGSPGRPGRLRVKRTPYTRVC